MSSNKEASKIAAEESAEPVPIVHDKRRFTPEGEPVSAEVAEEESQTTPEGEAFSTSEIEQLQTRVRELEEMRVEAERKVADFADRFRKGQEQLKAETEEQRARIQRTFDQKLESARCEILTSLLETLDNLKRAVAAAEGAKKRNADFDALLDGVRATASMFEAKMQSFGLAPVPSVGEDFDPEIHEAVEMTSVSPERDQKVIDEFQTGYRLGERLLRPARVRVGRAK